MLGFVAGCHVVPSLKGHGFARGIASRRPGNIPSKSVPVAELRRGSSEGHRESGEDAAPSRLSLPGARNSAASKKRVYIVGKITVRSETVQTQEVDPNAGKSGLFGVQAKAYWDSIGVFPLASAGFGIVALVVKLAKVKKGEWSAASEGGVNKAVVHASVVTNEKEESELHVYKCGGCGYEIYPARGREFKFFGDDFKCPCCGAPKSEFWDRNDPDDPRNQEEEEEEDDADADDDEEDGGPGGAGSDIPGSGPAAKDVVAQNKAPPSAEDLSKKP